MEEMAIYISCDGSSAECECEVQVSLVVSGGLSGPGSVDLYSQGPTIQPQYPTQYTHPFHEGYPTHP